MMTVIELAKAMDWVLSTQCDVVVTERIGGAYRHLGEFPLFEFMDRARREYGGLPVSKIEHYPHRIVVTIDREAKDVAEEDD